MTLSIKRVFVTISTNGTRHNNTVLSAAMLSTTMLSATMLSATMLSATMLSATMLSAAILSAAMLSVTMLSAAIKSAAMLVPLYWCRYAGAATLVPLWCVSHCIYCYAESNYDECCYAQCRGV
jgi:hypothetical protein